MKKIICIFLCLVFIFTMYGCNNSILKEENNNVDNNETDLFSNSVFKLNSDIDYSELLHLEALNLTQFKSNNLGFSIVGSKGLRDKSEYIYSRFEEIGLKNVSYIPVITDGWELSDITMVYPCTCSEAGYFTLSKVGVYPSNFNFNETVIDFIHVDNGNIEKYDGIDVTRKGVIINTDVDIVEKVSIAKSMGAVFVIFKSVNVIDGGFNQIDLTLRMPDDIPVFSISANSYSTLTKEISYGDSIPITVNGSSLLTENVEHNFVMGEIVGKETDKYIYITANMDTYFQGYQSSCVSIAEMFIIADILIDNDYLPEYTIRFLVTSGSEWSSIDNSKFNIGLKHYLSDISIEDIKFVIVIDGNKFMQNTVFSEIQVSDNLFNIINEYNDSFNYIEYNVINSVGRIDTYRVSDALVWNEFIDNIILQAEYKGSVYQYYENSTADAASLGVDSELCLFVLNYYLGIVNLLCKK